MNGLLHHLLLTLRLNFRSKQAIVYGYVVPIFFLFAFGSFFRSSNPPLIHEMGQLLTVTILGGACFGMPTAMVAERERGVWRRYRLLPSGIGGIIVSNMVARFVLVVSAGIMQIALARLFYGTFFPKHPVQMLGAFAVVSFSFLGLGLIIAMLADSVPAVQALGQALFLPMIMIGGVALPVDRLPEKVRWIASFLPGRYAVEVLQQCQNGVGLSGSEFNIAALVLIGVFAILAGTRLFRWDAGQKVAAADRVWVAVALAAWVIVGIAAERIGQFGPRVSVNLAMNPSTHPTTAVAIAPATMTSGPTSAEAATEPAISDAWKSLPDADIQGITYDELPDDNGTVIPLAADLNNLDEEGAKRIEAYKDALSDWPPAQVQDLPQRLRNLLSVCSVADVAQDQLEPQIPLVTFNYMRVNVQKDRLIKALAWIILHPDEGTVLTDIKDIKELKIDAVVPEEEVRQRNVAYAKKFLIRLLDKLPKKPQ